MEEKKKDSVLAQRKFNLNLPNEPVTDAVKLVVRVLLRIKNRMHWYRVPFSGQY